MIAFDSYRDLNYFRERENKEEWKQEKSNCVCMYVYYCIFVCLRKCQKKRKQKKEKNGVDSEEGSNHDMCYLR